MTETVDNLIHSLQREFFQSYPAEATHCLEELTVIRIADVLNGLPQASSVRIWERLSPAIAAGVLKHINDEAIRWVFSRIEPNKAAAIISSLADDERQRYFELFEDHIVRDFELAMMYPADSAGAMMSSQLIYYTPDMQVRETVRKLRTHRRPAIRVLFIVDHENRLSGMVEVQDLALADRDAFLKDMMQPARWIVQATTTREEMVDIFEKRRVMELPVVDLDGHLIGVVSHHVLIDAAKEEGSIDIQTMVGVSKDERASSKASFAVKKRLPWLQVNLATAFLAAAVVGIFEQTIAQVTALAVLLPIVAGQSGNAGAQALAVTMRGLILHEVWPRQWPAIIFKEFNVGLWNGVAVALVTALGVYIWSQSAGLCLIISVSMVIFMIIASVAGAVIPILLVKTGQDPATSSSIFLTTITDVTGFFSFLGIATLLMGLL